MGNLLLHQKKHVQAEPPPIIQLPRHPKPKHASPQLLDPPRPGKIKPIIANATTWRCLLPTDLASITKYRPKIISNLHLTCLDYDSIGAKGLKVLCKSLKDTKNVSSLKIDTKAPNTKQLPHLLNLTNHWKKLGFNYNQTERNLDEETIKKLTKLRRCRDLSNLEIFLNGRESNQVIEERMSRLSQQIRGFSHLKSFNLYFNSHCGDYTPFFCFRFPRSLSSLTIFFRERNIPEELVNEFLSNIQHLSSLEHLDVSFNLLSTSIEPQFWDKFFEKIQRLKSLRFCKTFYGEDSQLSEGTKDFLQGFSQLKNLTSLDLFLDHPQEEIQVRMFLNILLQHLASFPNFKSLSLNHIDRTSQKPFSVPSVQHLAQLERLELRLHHSDCINNFLQSLQHLQNLKYLDLHIWNTKEISFLASSVQRLTNLQTLNLYCNYLNQDSTALEILLKSIAQFHLKSLTLTFGEEKSPTKTLEKSPDLSKDFANLLNRFHFLSNLSLNLSAFDLSLKESQCLSLALKELKQLNSLSLRLPLLKFESLHSFMSSIKKMPKLISLSLGFDTIGLNHKGIHDLASDLGDCPVLENLNLHLKTFKFHREMFRSLLFGIANLSLLRNLELTLGGINTYAPPDDLWQELSGLKNIESIDFIVSWAKLFSISANFDKNNFEILKEKLKDHPNSYKRLVKLQITEHLRISCF